ncbi:MAG: glycosyltransferase family 2 protein [Candidatus Omnitrophica bacterium]|nr:glycosyltransferase family 2 protein [Candidatus Omnitrophota bacterium]
MKETVSIIIVNHNRKEYLKRCLDSALCQSYPDIEVIAVDNASTDGSVELLKNMFSSVTLILNKDNEMYARAQNSGISQSRGQYVLCLNNDAVLDNNYVAECVKIMSEKKDVGMVTGKVLLMDGKTIDSTGQFLSRSRRPYDRGYRKKDKGQYATGGYVFGPGGAAPLFRRSMLEELSLPAVNGGYAYFDEDYGMFYEDLDLAWRANRRGWRAYYNPKAAAYHVRGGSCQEKKTLFLFRRDFVCLPRHLQSRLIKNRYATIIKNESIAGFLSNGLFILGYDLKLFLYMFLLRPALFIDLFRDPGFLKYACHKRKYLADTAA